MSLKTSTPESLSEPDASALLYYNAAVAALDLLYESAASGYESASEELAHLSDTLADKADCWRRMKYLQK